MVYPFTRPDGRRVWLLDTPGFDDTFRSDVAVLREIAAIFNRLGERVDMAGIIYLHAITDVRMRGSARRNLKLLKNVLGEGAYKHLALVTTKWECFADRDRAIAEQREFELKADWWDQLERQGSLVRTHHGTADSARDIVRRVIINNENRGPFSLRICDEMVEQHLDLHDTTAGKELTKEVRHKEEEYRRQLAEAREEFNRALVERQDQHAVELSRHKEELSARIQEAEQDQERLRARWEDILKAQRAEHEQALREIQQQRDDAERRALEMEKELLEIRKALVQDRQEFERQRREYEQRIEDLEQQGRDREARDAKAQVARQESSYQAQNQKMTKYQDDVNADYQTAYKAYQQYCAACKGSAAVINNIFINTLNVSR